MRTRGYRFERLCHRQDRFIQYLGNVCWNRTIDVGSQHPRLVRIARQLMFVHGVWQLEVLIDRLHRIKLKWPLSAAKNRAE